MLDDPQVPSTLVHLLHDRAGRRPDKIAFSNMSDGETVDASLTYAELDRRAREVAALLHREGAAGERVLLVYPQCLDFVVAFFGCLYAGAVAVPAYPPSSKRLMPRLDTIISDAAARLALTTEDIRARWAHRVSSPQTSTTRWIATDALRLDDSSSKQDWEGSDPDALAVIQYTSGSTSSPKGVMLSHRTVMHNLGAIRDAWQGGDDEVGVFWLPLHHDMGLIGGVLETIYVGGTSTLLSPAAFVARPMRWLEALSRTHATISAAPGFAYDMCVDRSTPQQRAALDLSRFRTAMCGAETVRPSTIRRFGEAFASAGFRTRSFYPVYGLAEATLMVTGRPAAPEPAVRTISGDGIREHTVIEVAPSAAGAVDITGCGLPVAGLQVTIVDPDTLHPCPSSRIGEICVTGPSVALGYWRKPAESARTFPTGADGRPLLRTGDLGFLSDSELFIVGRLKDLIIIRGRNHYPDDIEAVVQACDPALLDRRGAAFSVQPAGQEEHLVVVQELDRRLGADRDLPAVCMRIRQAIAERYDIAVRVIVLVSPLRIPTTSSGKIQRHLCRQDYLDGILDPLEVWTAPDPVGEPPADAHGNGTLTAADVQAWLVSRLAAEFGLRPDQVDPAQPFAYYGLDSVRAVRLIDDLRTWLGRDLPPELAYGYPTIELLASHLAPAPGPDASTGDGLAVLASEVPRLSDAEVDALLQRMLASRGQLP